MPLQGGTPKVITTLFGGQGTINVPSWSADSKYRGICKLPPRPAVKSQAQSRPSHTITFSTYREKSIFEESCL
jgi:hypothetical protein